MSVGRVAVLGLGSMGAAAAGRLCSVGVDIVVWNRSQDHADIVVAAGARVAATSAEAVADREVVISPADETAVELVLAGPDGAVHG
ncbi:MAG: NAD(P)-binding domain-containing protein, partial [Phycicoccus sp.]